VAQVDEVEPKPDDEGAYYAPGSVPVIEQAFDQTVRGDEPVDIVLSPDGSRAYTAGRNTDNLFVIDLSTNQIVDVIDLYPTATHPLGPAPEHLAITPDGIHLLVTNANDESLTVIDTRNNSIIETLSVGAGVADVAISPDGNLAYVPNHSDASVTVIDVPAAEVLTTVNLRGGWGPFAVAFAPDGSRAYVALQSGTIAIIDPATHRVVGSFSIPSLGSTGDLVISPDGRTGYVNALDGGKVIVLDLSSRRVADTYEVTLPIGLALSADGTRLYVGTFGFLGHAPYNVFLFDTRTGRFIRGGQYKHPAPYNRVVSDIEGLALSPAGDALYFVTLDGDGVVIADPETLDASAFIPLNPIAEYLPLRAAVSPDGARLYVVSGIRRPTFVSVIDTRTCEVTQQIISDRTPCEKTGVGMGSFGLDISPDGSMLYVLATEECVLEVDTRSLSIVDDFSIRGVRGLVHLAIHPDGELAYVLAGNANVYVVDLATKNVIKTITTDVTKAYTIKLSADASRAYVAGDFGYAVLDLRTETVLMSADFSRGGEFGRMHGRALGVKPDSSQYLIVEMFNLHVYDSASNREIRNIDLFDWNPGRCLIMDIVFSPDGKTGYTAMWDEKAVLVYDAHTWQVTAKIDTGRAPYFGVCPVWLVVSPDGDVLYVVCEEGDNVLVVDTATHRVIETISLLD